ncbi:MAG TPA: RNA 2',3'-cyclic phosphodiesterase [Blastocatellia bacterium]|nr:RNA 2',3'-cyclic phosphodiesterase [Blastocatellia bacterium]
MTIRTFICIEIPESIKERIRGLQQSLRRIDAQASWVKPENIHLTLKFLGDVESTRIERVRDGVERASGSTSRFQVTVGGAGCFPSPKSPRVLWVGLSGMPDELLKLHKQIEDSLAREGFPRDAKKFSPHLTIARLRAPRNASQLAEALIATGFEPGTFEAREVIVMRSDLNPKGSIYTPQAIIPLN